MAPGVISQQGTNTFITSVIPPTMVTTPNFFVGFLITHTAGQFPAAFDEDAPTLSNRSWVAQTTSINDLSGAITIESAGLVGNWLIRADGNTGGPTPTGTPSPTPTATATPCTAQYTVTQIGGSIVAGTTDTGNHCDVSASPRYRCRSHTLCTTRASPQQQRLTFNGTSAVCGQREHLHQHMSARQRPAIPTPSSRTGTTCTRSTQPALAYTPR